jgi:23S rRNA (cytosine1962-C5)-methyltransferase
VDYLEGSVALLVSPGPPCILFEDEHLLVVNKPAGLNTHAPGPFAGEGIYDWLRNREPRWAALAIVHRLDKETSGVLVFSKSRLANQSLTRQFSAHEIRKRYVLLTDRTPVEPAFTVTSALVRSGSKYYARPMHQGADQAETRFRVAGREANRTLLEAEPITGKTHQIRVHAALKNLPILGDPLYGGTSAPRLCLHARELSLAHPATGQEQTFTARPDFDSDPHLALRQGLIEPDLTNACRLVHGASDGWPEWYLDRLAGFLLSQSEEAASEQQRQWLDHLFNQSSAFAEGRSAPLLEGLYERRLRRHLATSEPAALSPTWLRGKQASPEFPILENGVRFSLSFREGYSVGLFLDQRDNRRRLLKNYVGPEFLVWPEGRQTVQLLNLFAYTCGFSVCAALAGAQTTSLDLSRRYLEWGKRNFQLNHLDPEAHGFIFGDAFDWLPRLTKKGRAFDVIILDPPTFSRSKEYGPFQVAKDFRVLVQLALPLLKPEGVLFCSSNAADWKPDQFLESIRGAIQHAGRQLKQEKYVPQPPDFPISAGEPGYLKTFWARVL